MMALPAKPAFSPTSTYWLGAKAIYQALRNHGAQNPLTIAALANTDMESAFKTTAVGDQGRAYNLWQWWWTPRGLRIYKATGIDVQTESSIPKIVDALFWEMTNVAAYADAYKSMQEAKSAEDAAETFCTYIEGAGAEDAKQRRAADAAWWTKAIAEHADFFAATPDP